MEKKRGILRVGRIKNASNIIKLPGFTSIVVMTASSKFGMLSPFQLKTKDGIIIENKWQFMKVYKKVQKQLNIIPDLNVYLLEIL